MVTKNQVAYIKQLIEKLLVAENQYAFKGSYPPETAREIEEDHKKAKQRVYKYLDGLTP